MTSTTLGGEGSRPRFTVITAAMNCRAFLGRTIESVQSQTRDDWEMIVHDDASSDDTTAVAARYLGDERIRLVRSDARRGIAGSRNRALEEARGSHIVVLDADDWILPDYLRRVGEVVRRDPAVTLVSPDAWRYVDPPGRPERRSYASAAGVPRTVRAEHQLARLLAANYVAPMATVRRDALLAVGGWRSEHDGIEDYDLWIRLLAAGGRVTSLHERLAVYRVRAGSVTHTPTGRVRAAAFERGLRLYDALEAELDLRPSERRALRRGRAILRRRAALAGAREALLAGDLASAARQSRRSFRVAPNARSLAIATFVTVAPRRAQRHARG